VGLPSCDRAAGRAPGMLAHLGRAVDLAIRFDNEYWLRREVRRDPDLFALPEARALLPADLREAAVSAAARPTAPRAISRPAATPNADLTVRMLGVVEIVRDPARPLAHDAWATRRARDILCFIASQPHLR